MQGEALLGLANIAASQGNHVEARQQAEASLTIFAAMGQTHMARQAKKLLKNLPDIAAERPPASE